MNKKHKFSIIAIRRSPGEFLQVYDKRWGCWLFPYVRSSTNNDMLKVNQFVEHILGSSLPVEYVKCSDLYKYSVSDNMYKVYEHRLYKLDINNDSDMTKKDTFVVDDVTYRWFDIADLLSDKNTVSKNKDVIDFVLCEVK